MRSNIFFTFFISKENKFLNFSEIIFDNDFVDVFFLCCGPLDQH
jgi:hypothetical protein